MIQELMLMHGMTGEVLSLAQWKEAFRREQGSDTAFPDWAAEVLAQVAKDEVSGEWVEVF